MRKGRPRRGPAFFMPAASSSGMRPDVASGTPQRRWRDGPHGLHLGTCDGHCGDLLRLQGTAPAVRSREQARSAVGAGQAEVVAGADFSLKRHFVRRALSKISHFRVGRPMLPVRDPGESRHRAGGASGPAVRETSGVSRLPRPARTGAARRRIRSIAAVFTSDGGHSSTTPPLA